MRTGFSALAALLPLLLSASVAGAAERGHGCLRALVSLPADTIPSTAQFVAADCGRTATRDAFRYDRSRHATRLARDLSAGEVVPAYLEYGQNVVLPGQPLEMVIAIGAVRIERRVVALQEARPGQRLFVRSVDGDVLPLRYEASGP